MRAHAELLDVGRPARREHRHGEHQRLLPGRERRRPRQRLAHVEQRPQRGERHRDEPAAAARGAQLQLDDLTVGQDVGAGQLATPVAFRWAVERGDDRRSAILGPQRLAAGGATAGERHRRQPGEPLQPRKPPVAGRVEQRAGERRRRDPGVRDRGRRERLGAVHPRGVVRGRAERHRPDEVLDPGALGGAQQAPGGDRVQLLQRRSRLVALGGGQVDDRADPAQRMAKGGRVGEVADRELDVHPVRPDPAGVAYQAAHGLPPPDEPAEHRRAEQAGGTGQEQHRAEATPTMRAMAYVIAEPCIGTKDNSCVEVCPVDCIHPTPDEPDYDKVEMLYIDPEECIDCDACVEACPVDACFAEDQLPEEWSDYAKKNTEYYAGR